MDSKTFCPIYAEARKTSPWDSADSAHAGLIFEKFADGWREDPQCRYAFDKGDKSTTRGKKSEADQEGYWLKEVFPRRYARTQNTVRNLLREACARQRALVESLGGRVLYVRNTARFVTGMGREHPLENGFAWHHTLGMPYVPGSSLKGMLRAWLREEYGSASEPPEAMDLFGDQGQVGRFILFDMLPTRPPKLEIDVMTPHYGPYYQAKQGDDLPGDWHSPVPIAFLTVAAGQSWQLGIAPVAGSRTIDEAILGSLVARLSEALEFAGAGAKTAVGYGRFVEDEQAQAQQAEVAEQRRREEEAARRATEQQAAFEQSLANDSEPLKQLKTMQRQQKWRREAGDATMIQALQRFVEENPNLPEDCLAWIREWIESIPNYRGVWTNPDATKGKRGKPKYQSSAIRELVKRLTQKRQ
ncbi:MAG: type III-B CRISPR module RAMP protein Cmr6 [Planctomycetota bacterium]|nr:MAG: type III-B CRISPR module RAMP protein Cmr6 [Planctomycetota bacterium]